MLSNTLLLALVATVSSVSAVSVVTNSGATAELDLSFARHQTAEGIDYDTTAVLGALTQAKDMFRRATGCTSGVWSCSGTVLSICNVGENVAIDDCANYGMACTAGGAHTGCIWPSITTTASVPPPTTQAPQPSASAIPDDEECVEWE